MCRWIITVPKKKKKTSRYKWRKVHTVYIHFFRSANQFWRKFKFPSPFLIPTGEYTKYRIPLHSTCLRLSTSCIYAFRTISQQITVLKTQYCRSQWPRGLRRGSAAARLLGLCVRIPPRSWIFVCCECCVLPGRGLCDRLISRPEESYRLLYKYVVVCDLEISWMRRRWLTGGGGVLTKNKQTEHSINNPVFVIDGQEFLTLEGGTYIAQDPRNDIMDLRRVNKFTPLPIPCSALPGAWNWSYIGHFSLVVWAVYIVKIRLRTGC